MKKLYIMIGVSGSGKSTKSRELARYHLDKGENVYILSADDYWLMLGRGYYNYQASRIGEAHLWNLRRFENAIRDNSDKVIIIDNTNLERRSMKNYAIPAYENGYEVEALAINPLDNHIMWERNSHGVAYETICRMRHKYDLLIHNMQRYKTFKEFIYGKD
jgi:NEDD4-binding protein 2